MNFQLDLGPGFSNATQYSSIDFTEEATGETSYFLTKANANVFGKLDLMGKRDIYLTLKASNQTTIFHNFRHRH